MIEVKNIQKKYKNKVLKDITFTAEKGECIVIFGSNGCGKTTMLEILSGCRKPDGGEILIFGKDPLKNKKIFSQYTGYVPQENPLIEDLSVKDNLRLWFGGSSPEFKGLFSQGALAERLGLNEIKNKAARVLSGGMKRRLSIAIALLNGPPILLLDEPTTALDLKYKEDVRNILRSYLKSGGTVIMTTHDQGDLSLCTRLMLLKDGVLKELDRNIRPQELIKQL